MGSRRADLKITQAYVAERIGKTQSTISKWESGMVKRLPGPGAFWLLSKILSLSAKEMLEAAGYLSGDPMIDRRKGGYKS